MVVVVVVVVACPAVTFQIQHFVVQCCCCWAEGPAGGVGACASWLCDWAAAAAAKGPRRRATNGGWGHNKTYGNSWLV